MVSRKNAERYDDVYDFQCPMLLSRVAKGLDKTWTLAMEGRSLALVEPVGEEHRRRWMQRRRVDQIQLIF
ncbi:hypothetical protein FNV43_RR13507 [Rhamnella rubrinervis]|uniref:Uncharacterized protein n=1 Tax=Rhamnella rubrinervis TaxID=2594499 RepID=A0A8K0H189_9ROSA|nr:hypothetical protein FNV43_RR13507 [Rhamnella rubrinervis]